MFRINLANYKRVFIVIMVKVLTWILHPSPEKEIKMYETNIIKAFKYYQNYSIHDTIYLEIWKSINAKQQMCSTTNNFSIAV